MDAQKWKHLFYSVGLPLIGWVLSQFFPIAHKALCTPLGNHNQPELKALSMSSSIEGTYNRLSEFVNKEQWGDYPLETKGGIP
jgi:hypothetical protein